MALAPALLAGAAWAQGDGGRTFRATLTGAAEVPGPGDPDGRGGAVLRINPGQGRLCFTLSVRNIDPARAAHVHEAAPGAAGPVVVPLDAPAAGRSEGCVDIARTLAQDIVRSPGDYYVNVHNAPYPGGAVRGQLQP